MCKDIFTEIYESYSNECIVEICKRLKKKFNIKSRNDLNSIIILGTWMYIFKDLENALRVFNITDNIQFNGDWDCWNEVYTAQILKAKIYSDLGEELIAENIKKDINRRTTGGVLNWKSNVDKVCTIPSDGKYIKLIDKARANKDKKLELEYTVLLLIYLLKYLEGSVFKDNMYESKEKLANDLIIEIQNMKE